MTPVSATSLPTPYLVFLGDRDDAPFAKTAFGLRDWARDICIGEASVDGHLQLGLPVMTPIQARSAGVRALVIGVANIGGAIKPSWMPTLTAALEAGLDIVSGMHGRLAENLELAAMADRLGRNLIDVRRPPEGLPIATGQKRAGRRLLTVGTDCALGKKYTALAIWRAFLKHGLDADFRATGQTGIMIAGSGIPMDAVVADFAAGAAEALSPDAAPNHWDIIEGQGSLFHPAYAGVSLALLHGSQPDRLVLCHDPRRTYILGLETFATPSLEDAIALNVQLARRTNPAASCVGVSLNTSGLSDQAAHDLFAATEKQIGLPAADPIRGGAAFERLVDACLAGA
jgi:uncharacterized NAD-dependent epimerase/dehydratase family protein